MLEAISLLSPGRGLRRAAYADVARKGEGADGSWAVAVTAMGHVGEVALGTGLVGAATTPEMGRRVRINGAPARTISELGEHLSLLWLTPAMDGLFTGPASERRRFLDRLVQALDPGHAVLTGQFERALRQRNRRLEEAGPRGLSGNDRTLDAIEAQVAELGLALSAARRGAVLALRDVLAGDPDEAFSRETFPQADIALEGEVEVWLDAMPAAEAEDRYRETLARTRPRDRAAGRTLTGPHRADLEVVHVQKRAPARLASTGEQKALLIGLTLAEARLVTERIGAVPILLLDEIAAHLDPARRAGLFAALERLGCQAWMTGTEPGPFEVLGARAQHLALDATGLRKMPSVDRNL